NASSVEAGRSALVTGATLVLTRGDRRADTLERFLVLPVYHRIIVSSTNNTISILQRFLRELSRVPHLSPLVSCFALHGHILDQQHSLRKAQTPIRQVLGEG